MKQDEDPIVSYGWVKYTVKRLKSGMHLARLTDYPNIMHSEREIADALAACFAELASLLRAGRIKP